MLIGFALAAGLLGSAPGQDAPAALADAVQQWRFDEQSLDGTALWAASGGLGGEILGEFKLADEGGLKFIELAPAAEAGGGILLTSDRAAADLPRAAMTAEAWVQLDSTLEWGGIIGAVRDTGVQEEGWVLGYRRDRFFFGLATEETKRITYLNSSAPFVLKAWYHLVATYDGTGQQRLYVDGQLSAQS